MKKTINKLIITSSILSTIVIPTNNVLAEEYNVLANVFVEPQDRSFNPNALLPPSKIWWDFTVHTNLGNPYYMSVARKDGIYRGYLSINWYKSAGGYYTYEGYLYPEGKPYPIPARKLEELK